MNRKTSLRTAAAIVSVAGAFAPGAHAQVDTGRVVGTITDPTGAIVPNTPVKLHNVATGINRNTTTGSDGSYQFIAVPAGNYLESVAASGFATYQAPVTVSVGGAATLDVKLTAAGSSTVVEVAGRHQRRCPRSIPTTPEISQVIDPQARYSIFPA